MKPNLIVKMAHMILSHEIKSNDVMVDATMGNGHDTLFLAEHAKHVYAFDIQMEALHATQHKMDQHGFTNYTLIHDSHEHIHQYVTDYRGVIFNLGYLPNHDKSITTKKETTLLALKSILPSLSVDGFVLLVVYVGHKEGFEESLALNDYFKALDASIYKVIKVDLPYQDNQPPYIIFIKKVKEESD